jgi:hypothetical protein
MFLKLFGEMLVLTHLRYPKEGDDIVIRNNGDYTPNKKFS